MLREIFVAFSDSACVAVAGCPTSTYSADISLDMYDFEGDGVPEIVGGNFFTGNLISLADDLGRQFDLLALDASAVTNLTGQITVIGTKFGGGTVSQTVSLTGSLATYNFSTMTDLASLAISFDGTSYYSPFDLDNIQLSVIPIPATPSPRMTGRTAWGRNSRSDRFNCRQQQGIGGGCAADRPCTTLPTGFLRIARGTRTALWEIIVVALNPVAAPLAKSLQTTTASPAKSFRRMQHFCCVFPQS